MKFTFHDLLVLMALVLLFSEAASAQATRGDGDSNPIAPSRLGMPSAF